MSSVLLRASHPASIVTLVLLGSCSGVTVRSATGPDDEGFHYFMPKFYLQVARSVPKAGAPAPSHASYDVQVVTLPDPRQRRTIIQRPGFGTANATGTLADGWKLTQFGSDAAGADLSSLVAAATGVAKLFIPPPEARAMTGITTQPVEPQDAGEEPVAILLGIDMNPDRRRLFDEAILIYRGGRTEVINPDPDAAPGAPGTRPAP